MDTKIIKDYKLSTQEVVYLALNRGGIMFRNIMKVILK